MPANDAPGRASPEPRPPGRRKAVPHGPARHSRAGSVEPGDHVYAHHPERGPVAMKVLACGRDGFTGECDEGRRHSVPYGRMLGHKSRVKLAMKVIDQGQEGAIVEDEHGRRRYVAGDLAPAPDNAATDAAADTASPAGVRLLEDLLEAMGGDAADRGAVGR